MKIPALRFSIAWGTLLLSLGIPAHCQSVDLPDVRIRTAESNEFKVIWGKSGKALTLEATDDLQSGDPWKPVLNPRDETAGEFIVSVPGGGPQRFFRLRDAPPPLRILSVGNNDVAIIWGETGEPATLETTSELGPLSVWTPVPASRVKVADEFIVSFAMDEAPRFFRLRENLPPVFQPVGPLAAMPGEVMRLTLVADDPDADLVTFSLTSDGAMPTGSLLPNGVLELRPQPTDLGSYTLTLLAHDGIHQVSQTVQFDVQVDPVITTRISGRVQSVAQESLEGVPIVFGPLSTSTDSNGAFMIEFSGAAPSDTLFLHAEQLPGPDVYPFIAEKIALLLGHELYDGFNNVIDRPIFLPVLDIANGVSIDPSSNVMVSVALQPGEAPAEVMIQAGSLEDQSGNMFTGVLSVTEVPAEFTPAALPNGLIPDAVVTIQPGEMVFTTPAPLTLPNRAGWAPGTIMDLWSINPDSGEFEVVGIAQVSADGTVVETISGGILNSSWHFVGIIAALFAPFRVLLADTFNLDDSCPDSGGSCAGFASGVQLHSGAVIETHPLVTYHSVGTDRGVTLVYDSLRADSRPIVHMGLNNATPDTFMTADLVARRGNFSVRAPGYSSFGVGTLGLGNLVDVPPGQHVLRITVDTPSPRISLQLDMRGLASGVYESQSSIGIKRLTPIDHGLRPSVLTGSDFRSFGTFVHVDGMHSPFGVGWGVAGLQELVENSDGSVLLIDGNGTEMVFEAPEQASDPYVSPSGEYSVLTKLPDDTFQRVTEDGTVVAFDSANRLSTMTDRNGNITFYEYDVEDRLMRITDPVGLETQLDYDPASGLLSFITDPANRITMFDHDADGNLVQVIDPDGSSRQWEYDTVHHMVAEIDKRGDQELAEYDFSGRAVRAIRKDGSVLEVQPVQTRHLLPIEESVPYAQFVNFDHIRVVTEVSLDNAAVPFEDEEPAAGYADGRTNTITSVLDGVGQLVSASDDIGPLPGEVRNEENRVIARTDGEGHTTLFEYDERGNVITIIDQISAAVTWISDVSGNWEDPLNWSTGVVPGSNDQVWVGANAGVYEITISSDVTLGSLVLGGASGTQTLAVAGGSLTAPAGITVKPSGLLSLTRDSPVNADVTNEGVVEFAEGDTSGGPSTFTNVINGSVMNEVGATFRISGGRNDLASLLVTGGFINAGTIELTSHDAVGRARLMVTGGPLDNETTGRIQTFAGQGGARTISATLDNRGEVQLQGADLTLEGTDAQHLNRGSISLVGGSLTVLQSGTDPRFTNNDDGVIDISFGRQFEVEQGVITNEIGGVLQGMGDVLLDRSTADFAGTPTIDVRNFVLNDATINSAGTLTIPAGSSLLLEQDDAVGDVGITNRVNADIVNGGRVEYSAGDVLSASLTFTAVIDGSFSNRVGATLRVSGSDNDIATLRVTGELNNEGIIQMTSHIHDSSGGSSHLVVEGGLLINDGTLQTLGGLGGSRFISATIDNHGVLRLLGAGLQIIPIGSNPSFTNRTAGVIEVQAPHQLEFREGLTFVNEAGAGFQGAGSVFFNKVDSAFASGVSVDGLSVRILEATMDVAGVLTVPGNGAVRLDGPCTVNADIVSHGLFEYFDGDDLSQALNVMSTIGGSFDAGANAVLRISADQNDIVTLRVAGGLTNAGTVELTSHNPAGRPRILVEGGSLVNEAGGTLQIVNGVSVDTGVITADLFENHGTIDLVDASLDIIAGAGNPLFVNGASGIISIHAGNQAGFSNRVFTNEVGGTVTGDGTLFLEGADAGFASGFTLGGTTLVLQDEVLTVAAGSGTLTISNGASLQLLGDCTLNAGIINEGFFEYVEDDANGIPVLSFTSTVFGAISNELGATLRISSGFLDFVTLRVMGGLSNEGTIDLTDFIGQGTTRLVVEGGMLVNESTGLIQSVGTFGSGTRTIVAQLDNRGTNRVQIANMTVDGSVDNHGTVDLVGGNMVFNPGGVNAGFTNATSGVISVAAGRAITLDGGVFTNEAGGTFSGMGTAFFDQSEAAFATDFSLGGLIFNLQDAEFNLSNGAGTMTIPAGSSLELQGDCTVNADIVNEGLFEYVEDDANGFPVLNFTSIVFGVISNESSAMLRISSGFLDFMTLQVMNGLSNEGTIVLTDFTGQGTTRLVVGGGLLVNESTGLIQSVGTFGGGTRSIISTQVTNSGTFDMLSGRSISISGDYAQTGTGMLNTEIAGTANNQIGRLTVGGAATLAGTLNVSVLGGTIVTESDEFEVMTYGSHSNEFDVLTGVDLGGGLTLSPAYNTNDFTFIAVTNQTIAGGQDSSSGYVRHVVVAGVEEPDLVPAPASNAVDTPALEDVPAETASLPEPEQMVVAEAEATPALARPAGRQSSGRGSVAAIQSHVSHSSHRTHGIYRTYASPPVDPTDRSDPSGPADQPETPLGAASMPPAPAFETAELPRAETPEVRTVEPPAPEQKQNGTNLIATEGGPGGMGGGGSSPAPLGRHYTYDPAYNQLTSITDELGHQTIYEVDPTNGNTRSITRVVGQPDSGSSETNDLVTFYTHTPRGQTDTIMDPRGRVTDFDYDAFGRLISRTYALGTIDQGTEAYELDAAGNIAAIIDANANRTEFEYDDMNRLTKTTEADPDGAGPLLSPVSETIYDDAGNAILVIDARGNPTSYEYDVLNRVVAVVDAEGNLSSFDYDRSDNLVSVVGPLMHEVELVYDERRRLTETIDAEGGRTVQDYDFNNNLARYTDPEANETDFTYDARDRSIAAVDPLGSTSAMKYDAVGNLIERTDRNGRRVAFTYDDLDRVTTESWLNPDDSVTNVIHYSYEPACCNSAAPNGNLISVTDNFSAITYTYDERGRISSVNNTGTPDVPNIVLTYGHDAVGNVLSATEIIDGQPGATNAYVYDALNRLSTLTQSGTGIAEKRADFEYNELGQLMVMSRFSDLAGSQAVIESTYSYDILNRQDSIQHRDAGSNVVAFFGYSFDAADRITGVTDIDGLTDYTYDDLDRITVANHSQSGNLNESYAYDANGNRTNSHLHGTGYVTGTGNRLLSDGTFDYIYDAAGNLVRRTEIVSGDFRELTWDHRNRLAAVIDQDASSNELQAVTYRYDALNRRIAKTVRAGASENSTHFVYDRGQVVLDFVDDDGFSGPNAPLFDMRYLQGPFIDHVLVRENALGEKRWHLANHLGTVKDLVDDAGAVESHMTYDSFGSAVDETNPSAELRFRYTGREFDTETGLYYYRARYYDAGIGRFLSEDPIGFQAGNANFYAYVDNEPIGSRDPTGLDKHDKIGLEGRTDVIGSLGNGAILIIASPGQQGSSTQSAPPPQPTSPAEPTGPDLLSGPGDATSPADLTPQQIVAIVSLPLDEQRDPIQNLFRQRIRNRTQNTLGEIDDIRNELRLAYCQQQGGCNSQITGTVDPANTVIGGSFWPAISTAVGNAGQGLTSGYTGADCSGGGTRG
jgi:RHS repeat-associated protein